MLITYNGISLPYSDATEFEEAAVYDDFSKVDVIASQFTLTVKFLIHASYMKLISPTVTFGMDEAAYPAEIMKRLSQQLLQPRRALSVKIDGVELIPNPPEVPGTVDSMNGPMPQYCRYLQLSSETFMVEWKVVATYVQNYDYGKNLTKPGGLALYNKWQEEVEIDDVGLSKITRTGEYRIRSDNISGTIPDSLREKLAVISVPFGFVRESAKYELAPDGLTLRYTVIDKEVFRFAPQGAYKAEGRYLESGKGMGAPIRKGDVQVKLYGPKNVDQAQLLLTAIRLCALKLKVVGAELELPNVQNAQQPQQQNAWDKIKPLFLLGIGESAANAAINAYNTKVESNKGKAILEQFDTIQDMYKNVVEVRMVARFTGTRRRRSTLDALQKNYIPVPYSNGPGGGTQPSYLSRGTANILLLAASYYDNKIDNNLGPVKPGHGSQSVAVPPGSLATENIKGLLPGEAGKTKET